MDEALFYEKKEDGGVRCLLCPKDCLIKEGSSGFCGVRKNEKGKLISLVYAKPCAINLDPVEKKPLFHFFPGKKTLSLGTRGCNLDCRFCQNWEISKSFCKSHGFEKSLRRVNPEEVVELCKEAGSGIISYTYTEPTIFYEYVFDTAKLAKKENIKNVLVTNGYINEAPLRQMCKLLDAANVDLKGFSDRFYKEYCSGALAPVLRTLEVLKEEGVWIEVTNLVIPGLNDKEEDFEQLALWIKEHLGRGTPLHLSAFHPDYKMVEHHPTARASLEKAKEICMKSLDFVYLGNVAGDESTFCPKCKALLVRRERLKISENHFNSGVCGNCKTRIPGVWR